ncbi:putative transcription factor Hap3/NF-YB family [Helianthus annuus]|nr:putative transcription factor Hap3/NF-YB family [Helianthus annuus]KAJ0440892.1 putative transcription factor Hap3/NF-YB family [Helianthus annuus]KAJ0458975.1 putative transcription factor Hap3/NF-YB family [Helianthus annuus]KAJ0639518.1 putative transcription factor Hap3/NF-YB family [Helianthus annuus]KAJ0819591.1 putative transcription factor Hap3/NF-YB family [Helianthus annuus]
MDQIMSQKTQPLYPYIYRHNVKIKILLEREKWEGGAKHHRKVFRNDFHGIKKPAMWRKSYQWPYLRRDTRFLKIFLDDFMRDAIKYTEDSHRRTITVMDVIYDLICQGCNTRC